MSELTKSPFKSVSLMVMAGLWLTACGLFGIGAEPSGAPAGNVTGAAPPATSAPPTDTPPPAPPTTVPGHPAAGLTFSTAQGLWVIGAEGEATLLSDQSRAHLSPDRKWIVYQAEEADGTTDIWLLDTASGEKRNLTHTPDRYEEEPAWWPGQADRVVFQSDIKGGLESRVFLTYASLDGRGYTILDEEEGAPYFAFSPDGQKIAYGGFDGTGTIYTWGVGREILDPAAFGISAEKLFQPTWSPDGRHLAWKAGGDLIGDGVNHLGVALFGLEAQTAVLLHVYRPQGGGEFPDYLTWSPDGEWLAFVTYGEDAAAGRSPTLWVTRPNGSDETNLGMGADPTWSVDSRHLAFLRPNEAGNQDVWLVETGTWAAQLQNFQLPVLLLLDWVSP